MSIDPLFFASLQPTLLKTPNYMTFDLKSLIV